MDAPLRTLRTLLACLLLLASAPVAYADGSEDPTMTDGSGGSTGEPPQTESDPCIYLDTTSDPPVYRVKENCTS